MPKQGAPGILRIGLTDEGHVLLTIHSEDGTETIMALTYSHFQSLVGEVHKAWAARRLRYVKGESK